MSATDATVSLVEGDATSPGLLGRLRCGDQAAWARCHRLYAPMVVRWCRLRGVSNADLPDVTQEVFVAAHRGLPKFEHGGGRGVFRGWLRAIARNEAVNHLRRRGPEGGAAGGSTHLRGLEGIEESERVEPDPREDEEEEENLRLLARALDAVLGEAQTLTRRVFWDLVIHKRTAAELAAEHGIKPAAVYSMKSRVMKKLRTEYDGMIDF